MVIISTERMKNKLREIFPEIPSNAKKIIIMIGEDGVTEIECTFWPKKVTYDSEGSE